MSADKLTNYESDILANIGKAGCFIPYVFDPDGIDPSFGYSVGFTTTVAQPEVITFGLPSDIVFDMINETLKQCREGLRLHDWCEINGLLEGHRCILRSVRAGAIEREFFSSANWYHKRTFGSLLGAAFQIVWPGTINKLFPWDEGCAIDVIQAQPALYAPRLH